MAAMSSTTSPRTIGLCIFLFVVSALFTYTFGPQHSASVSWHANKPGQHRRPPQSSPNAAPRLAYATFLAGNANPDRAKTDAESEAMQDNDDGYFLGARVLTYQLLHSPITATNLSIPFLVLVTDDVPERKRARLRADGATVIPVEKLASEWVRPADQRWRDVLAKLRLWEQEQYSKICFLDSDTLVTRRLDDVFFDEATLVQTSLPNAKAVVDNEGKLPRTYMFASHIDYFGYEHEYPPKRENGYFNVGFFVFSPSKVVFDYYVSLLANEGKFNPAFPEQNLLNYAHRREGNMPWMSLWEGWNVNWPTEKDWRNGVASFHAKYWDGDPSHDRVLKGIWREQRAEMEGYWRGKEARQGRLGGFLGSGL